MPEKHLIDTLIFIFCATSAQKKPFHFFLCLRRSHGGTPPFQNFWIRPWKERKKQPGREGEREGRQGEREGRQAGGSEGGQAGRERGRVGRERVRAGRQAGGDGGHADQVLLNTFHLVLTYSTREWDTTLL